jgi:hypothetical protein
MGIELPPELADVAAQTGVKWPAADEDKMRTAAQAWRDTGQKLHTLINDADTHAQSALRTTQGGGADAAREHWNGYVKPDTGRLTSLAKGCTTAADHLDHAANQIGEAKLAIVRNLVPLANHKDVAQHAAAAGHPTALLGLDTAVKGTAANLANVHQTLVTAVQPTTGTTVNTQTLVDPTPGAHGHNQSLLGDVTNAAAGPGGVTDGLVGGHGKHGLVDVAGPGGVTDTVVGGPGGHGPLAGVTNAVAGPGGVTDGLVGGHGNHGVVDVAGPGGVTDTVVGGHGNHGVVDVAGPGGVIDTHGGQGVPGVMDPPGRGHDGGFGPGGPGGPPDLAVPPGHGMVEPVTGPIPLPAGHDLPTPPTGIPDHGVHVASAAPAVLDAPPPTQAPQSVQALQSPVTQGPVNNPGSPYVSGNPAVPPPAAPGPTAAPAPASGGPVPPAPRAPVGGPTVVPVDAVRHDPVRQDPGRPGPAPIPGQVAPLQVPPGENTGATVLAIWLVRLFPLGHMPVAADRPARQLPSPSSDHDYAPGLRFEPHDHPLSDLIDDRHTTPVGPSEPRDGTELAVGYDSLAGDNERDWDRRFVVRAGSGRDSWDIEYNWPPAEMFPEGASAPGEPDVLEAGTVIDRFGPPEGRVFAADGTAFGGRSLPPSHLRSGYRRYQVLRPLPVWRGVSAAWFGQPGGGVRYRTVYPAQDLVALGYLTERFTDEG